MRPQRCSTLLFVLVLTGCLQPITPVPPVSDTLESKISVALKEDRQATAALANQVALTPKEADQKTLWVDGRDKISTKSATVITEAIRAELKDAGEDADKISNVWKGVAKGYGI